MELARETGQLLLGYYRRSGVAASLKPDRSLVTEADLEADRLIAESIGRRFPGETLVSEELNQSLPEQPGRAVWVVDPLDGTTNFSLGLPIWGVLLARLVDGWPQTAVCYFPLLDEMYIAERGTGAFLSGEPIWARPLDPAQPSPFFACCGRTHRRYQVGVPYKPRILGSSAYTLCSVARGAAVLGFEAAPKLWDLAGAWLVVEEAGGIVAPYAGQWPFPLAGGKDYGQTIYPLLAAATSEMIEKGRGMIQPK